MRNLQAHDIFAAARVIKAIGVKDELKEICQKSNNISDVWGRGYDFIYTIFEKAVEERAEDLIFEFLAGVMEKPVEEIKNGDALELLEMLTEKESVECWKAFFTKLASLITTIR